MDEKLLLVDDEEDIRDVLGISLSDIGYRVYTAENGEEALRIFEEVSPPIVLTDIRMPGVGGVELLQKIKQQNPDTEVIMITGHGDMELAIESLKLEATDFITKPINDDVLEIALKRAHERISMRRQIREHTENLEELVREKSEKLVEAERLLALGQLVDGLSSTTKDMREDLEGGIKYFNEMPCLVSIHNRDLKVVAANQLYKNRLGDKIGGNSWDVYTEEAGTRTTCPVGRTFDTRQGQRIRATVLDKEGEKVPVTVYTAPIQSTDRDVELVLEITADITEINRLKEDLRTTQQRFHQLFDEAPCYISVQDGDLRLAATNRRFKEDFGGEIGAYCYTYYKNRETQCPECPVIRTFEEGTSQQYETVVTSKTGEQYNVLVWTAPIRDSEGEITHVMEMSTNITQVRKLQDHLTSLGLLFSTMSHGIKGLLTGLDGGIYWIDSGMEKGDPARMKKGGDAVKLIVGRIKNLVLNMLFYAKERDPIWEKVHVIDFVSDIIRSFEPKLRNYHIEFEIDFDESVGTCVVDSGSFSSALINVLDNAMDACIEDTAKENHKIIFRLTQDEDYIVYDIEDNGVGMDRETKENMFTLFFSSKGARGTGLGLFVTHEIIQQHGGSIEVDSSPGEGSHFHLKIPKVLPKDTMTAKKPEK